MTDLMERTDTRTTDEALPVVRVMLGLLNLDRGYQREIRPHKIRHLKANWDWVKFYPLRVSRRVGGSRAGELFIWDGQHRYLAASELFGEYQEIPCYISDMTATQEALYFALQHEGETGVGGNARFKALVAAGDPAALDVMRITKDSGYYVTLAGGGNSHTGNTIAAISNLSSIYRNAGPEGLQLTLYVTSHAWPVGIPGRVEYKTLAGVAHFIHHFPEADIEHLIQKLMLPDATPQRLIQSAAVYSMGMPNSKGMNPSISRAILDRYNKGLRANQRLSWDTVKYQKKAKA